MSVLRHSSAALRRMVCRANKAARRSYATISAPLLQIAQAQTVQQVRTQRDMSALPLAVALLGLSFSTYSTHQLMLAGTSKDLVKKGLD